MLAIIGKKFTLVHHFFCYLELYILRLFVCLFMFTLVVNIYNFSVM